MCVEGGERNLDWEGLRTILLFFRENECINEPEDLKNFLVVWVFTLFATKRKFSVCCWSGIRPCDFGKSGKRLNLRNPFSFVPSIIIRQA